MNPQDPYQPQQPYQPQPTPQTPPQPQQNGQYNVVPPIVASSSTTGHNPYEFIFNSQAQKKTPSSMLKRLLFVGIGVALLAVVFMVVSSMFSAGGSANKELVKTVVQQQQELIWLAREGGTNLNDASLKNTAMTLQLSTASSQSALLAYADKNGFKIDPKELDLLHDADTEKLLENAKTTSTFDTTWKQTTRAQLEAHAVTLKKLHSQTQSASLKKILQTAYNNVVLVNGQLKE